MWDYFSFRIYFLYNYFEIITEIIVYCTTERTDTLKGSVAKNPF